MIKENLHKRILCNYLESFAFKMSEFLDPYKRMLLFPKVIRWKFKMYGDSLNYRPFWDRNPNIHERPAPVRNA